MAELHYCTYDPEEIYEDMIDAYVDAGGDILYSGDEKDILLRGVQAILVQAFAGVDNALRMATLRYAVGEYLDVYGEKRNCVRIPAVAATGTVNITAAATGSAQTIEAGTTLTADGIVLFKLDSDVSLSGSAETVSAVITAVEPGAGANGLADGTQMRFTNNIIAVTNILLDGATGGGRDKESDDNYRERIRTYGLSYNTAGSRSAYEAKAKEVSTQIIDAYAKNNGAGAVLVTLLLESGAVAADIIAAVTAALSADEARPLTDTVTVQNSTAKSYTLNITYTGSGISGAVDTAVENYKAWQNNTIGRAFNPDILVALIYQAGATLVTIDNTSSFDGGSAVYTAIGDTEHCTGTVNVMQNT